MLRKLNHTFIFVAIKRYLIAIDDKKYRRPSILNTYDQMCFKDRLNIKPT